MSHLLESYSRPFALQLKPNLKPEADTLSTLNVGTCRFMGSYKLGYKSPNRVITTVILLITVLLTTHEPPLIEH